ncbi:MAG TPA: 30S ribosomal protein S4 [Patescibacteria group bacterium]|nr:30S ribosomal protein S4 [Patescibacteria group bacterium]
MARNLDPKCKQCRREGTKLFLKGERCYSSKCAMVKRNYIPGVHGNKLRRGARMTDYGRQLREKQKARRTYRILEEQFYNYYKKAMKQKGETGDNLFKQLETRFDNTLYRAGFSVSRDAARQAIRHGHFLVNGKKLDIPSYQVKLKDKITINPSGKEAGMFKGLTERLKNQDYPDWLNIDIKSLEITVLDLPELEKAALAFDMKAIIEFYSR